MKEKAKDPFFGLKYIAYLRTSLSPNKDDRDDESVVSFAKWQICKVRNVLWNDPIWESYTAQEILIEFFTIRFDEDEELRKKFETGLTSASEDDLEWFERMEKKYSAENNSKIGDEEPSQSPPIEPEEFEVKF